jgi:predicted nucleic acid-binding protein
MAKGGQGIKTAFLDSSVLFTAVNSPSGGSSKLFTIKNLKLITSLLVLTEVERNVRKKLQSHHLSRFFLLVDKLEILKQKPDENTIRGAKKVIAKKDSVILAEAKKAKVDYVFTLDRKHFLTKSVEKFLGRKKVLTPKIYFESLET